GSGIAQLHDGTITISGVQVDPAGNVSQVSNARFVLDTVAPTLDLHNTNAGTGTSTAISAALATSFSSNSALLPNVAAVTDADVLKITLDFAETGNGLKAGDRLKVGSIGATAQDLDLNSATDLAGTGVSLGSLTGLDYSYSASSHQLSLFKHDGSAFAENSIAWLLGSLQFMNPSATPGTRDFAVQLIDRASNDVFAAGSLVI
ncbi:MAG: hypothetical protein ORN28_01410, partial [Rhodoferax sp.]|nr:hypothetical protein [Rhodoferax sp.]